MIFCASVARIFTALLREHERGVRLVIAEARVGCGHDFTSRRKTGRGERAPFKSD